MNPEEIKNKSGDEASRVPEESSSTNSIDQDQNQTQEHKDDTQTESLTTSLSLSSSSFQSSSNSRTTSDTDTSTPSTPIGDLKSFQQEKNYRSVITPENQPHTSRDNPYNFHNYDTKDTLTESTNTIEIEPSLTNQIATITTPSSPSITTTPPVVTESNLNSSAAAAIAAGETDEMKRAAAKKLIERYFYQLLDGCGNPKCNNKYCASSGEVEKLTPNQAAARAIQLFSQDAKLCDSQPSKVARTTNLDCSSSPSQSSLPSSSSSSSSNAAAATIQKSNNDNEDDTNTSSHLPRSSTSSSKPHSDIATTSSSSNLGSNYKSTDYPSTTKTNNDYTSNIGNSNIDISNSSHNDDRTLSSSPPITITYLDEESVLELIEHCKNEKSHSRMVRTIGEVFSSFELLSQSFVFRPRQQQEEQQQQQASSTIDEILKKAPKDLKSIKKEDLRTLEGDLDKDEDSSAEKDNDDDDDDDDDDNNVKEIESNTNDTCITSHSNHTTVDLLSLRRAMQKLFECDYVFEALNNGLHSLAIVLSVDLRLATQKDHIEKSIHIFVIVFEIMAMASSEFLEVALPNICRAAARLPVWAQARLARIWAEHCKSSMRSLLQTLQQLISLQVITGNFLVHDNEVIISTTKVLKILYYANILAGQLESPKLREDDSLETSSVSEDDSFFNYSSNKQQQKSSALDDKLSNELGISVLDCRVPYLPFEEFYNEPLSDSIDMDHDYLYYKNLTYQTPRLDQKFCFMLYSFILTPATKIIGLYYDSRIRMYSERRTIIWSQSSGQSRNPYLKLKVRRDQIIDDALVELEMIAMGNPKDLKKQLVVEFVGEQGIDEGGVSKEFFQLIVEEIFNPDYGMFIYQEDTKTVWFNSTSFENEAQFTLIGIVLGLAIYNNIILAVNFPMVVYRKLMGIKGSFHDLFDWNPVLYKSLQSMLEYDGDDMEDVFMQTFKITYKDVFGNTLEYELKPNGDEIFVNQTNKYEFVELYSDYLLNTSIKKQFKAFRNGFQMVTDESPLQLLFRPEEIELLVCGSKKFDFVELEKSTEYEGGYTEKSQIIIDFWNIVHALPLESKRRLLEFTTGSDRVPVGGLSRLKLVIARNGPDSDRLPTSHTCFNVLLLPEYSSKDKLEDRLLKAINYSKGFGML